MPNTRYRLRSELPNLTETVSLLTKIAANLADQDNRVVFMIGEDQFNSHDCTGVVIDPLAAHDNIIFRRPGPSANVAAAASLPTTTPITLTSAASGAARNTTTFTVHVSAPAANPTNTVLVAFTGTSSAVVVTVTPNDGTHNSATPVNLTTAQLVTLINSGAVGTVTLTDGSALRALQTATGGGSANLAHSGEGDGVVGTFGGGVTALPLEYYSIANIQLIRRLRTKKHFIHIDALASAASGD